MVISLTMIMHWELGTSSLRARHVSVGSRGHAWAAASRALKRPFLWPSLAARSPDSEAGREAASLLCATPAACAPPSRLLALLRAPSPGVLPAGARRCASMSAEPFAMTGDSGGGASPCGAAHRRHYMASCNIARHIRHSSHWRPLANAFQPQRTSARKASRATGGHRHRRQGWEAYGSVP